MQVRIPIAIGTGCGGENLALIDTIKKGTSKMHGTVIEPNQYIKQNNMSNQKQFGIWMDTHAATIVHKQTEEPGEITVVASVSGEKASPNSSEKTAHNQEKSLQSKFFKEIAAHLQNATHVHITGTGQAQEQFIHYLADTPQFKNTRTEESTSNKMSDERLVEFMETKLR